MIGLAAAILRRVQRMAEQTFQREKNEPAPQGPGGLPLVHFLGSTTGIPHSRKSKKRRSCMARRGQLSNTGLFLLASLSPDANFTSASGVLIWLTRGRKTRRRPDWPSGALFTRLRIRVNRAPAALDLRWHPPRRAQAGRRDIGTATHTALAAPRRSGSSQVTDRSHTLRRKIADVVTLAEWPIVRDLQPFCRANRRSTVAHHSPICETLKAPTSHSAGMQDW